MKMKGFVCAMFAMHGDSVCLFVSEQLCALCFSHVGRLNGLAYEHLRENVSLRCVVRSCIVDLRTFHKLKCHFCSAFLAVNSMWSR